MSPQAQAATDRMLAATASLHTERARLRGALRGLCDAAGFTATAAAMQAELQALAENERAAGRLPGGWIA